MVSLVWLIVALIVAVPSVTTLVFFNRLVTLRNRCNEAWSNVDTELKRRHNLVPNLVATVKGYASHERSVLESVTQARTRAMAPHAGAKDQQADENPLVGALKTLFAVAEGYPELKASRNFLSLQEELSLTEDRIQAARRFYNANVRDYRNTRRTFPGFLFARLFSFEEIAYFQIEPLEIKVPHVEMNTVRDP